MKTLVSLIVLLLLQLNSVLAVGIAARFNPYCSYLIDKIYCYGGLNNGTNYLTDMASLYVHSKTPADRGVLSSAWEVVSPSSSSLAVGREYGQSIASPDRTKMYLHGGYNTQSPIDNTFVMFDTLTTAWSTIPDFKQFNLNNPSINRATVSYAPSINKFVFYGGTMQNNDNVSVVVNDVTINPNYNGLQFGFINITTFDPQTQQWAEITNATNPDPENFIYALSSISVPSSRTSFFFGGGYTPLRNPSNQTWVYFKEISGIKYPEYTWNNYPCFGQIPAVRDQHTTTLLPDNKTVLLYGGTNNYETVLTDYCYLLDIETMIWRDCAIQLPPGTTGPRRGHSAVLVGNYLFLLFGLDNSGRDMGDVLILNVANSADIKFVQEYAYEEASLSTNDEGAGSNGTNKKESDGLGTGAIVGIAVGCVALIAIIIGVIFFMRRKKKVTKPDSLNNFPDDWDQLDQGFSSQAHREDIPPLNNQPKMSDYGGYGGGSATVTSSATVSTAPPPYMVVKPHESSAPILSKPNA